MAEQMPLDELIREWMPPQHARRVLAELEQLRAGVLRLEGQRSAETVGLRKQLDEARSTARGEQLAPAGDDEQERALQELVDQAQELNLYEATAEPAGGQHG